MKSLDIHLLLVGITTLGQHAEMLELLSRPVRHIQFFSGRKGIEMDPSGGAFCI